MAEYVHARIPDGGDPITFRDGTLRVPRVPIVPFIQGDGIGAEIWEATRTVLDGAVETAYGDHRRIAWMEVYAGDRAWEVTGEWLPRETLDALKEFRVGLKGPLATPVGGGIRSLNVTIRQALHLHSSVRPVRWIPGVPSPMKEPEKLDVVIFRENTEDVYAGIEWASGSPGGERVLTFLREEADRGIPEGSAVGIKLISALATRRHVAASIRYARDRNRGSVTLVHKGNIMKFTEGAFRDWGYQVAREEFDAITVTEAETWEGASAEGMILIRDRLTDHMFQEILLHPERYDVITTPNLTGDYLADACAAQVGGRGMAPSANLGDGVAVFEAPHGTAPRLAGLDRANPIALILSGALMLEHLGWDEAAGAVARGLEGAVQAGTVPRELAVRMEGATPLPTSGFARAVVSNI